MHKKGKKLVHSVQQALFYRSNAGEKNTGLCKKKKKKVYLWFYLQYAVILGRWGQKAPQNKTPNQKPQSFI